MLVNDKSTANINKINKALKELFKTAQSLKKINIDLKVKATGLEQAVKNLKTLQNAVKSAKSSNINVKASASGVNGAVRQVKTLASDIRQVNRTRATVHVNSTGLSAAQRRLNALRASAARPINVNVHSVGGATTPPGIRSRGTQASSFSRFTHGLTHGLLSSTVHISQSSIMSMSQAIGQAVGHAIGKAAIEGGSAADKANMALRLRGISKEGVTAVNTDVIDAVQQHQRDTQGGAPFVSRAEALQLYSDIYPITGGDARESRLLMEEAITTARQGYARGQTRDEAIAGMLSYVKVGEQTRAFFADKPDAQGRPVIDDQRVADYFIARRQQQAYIGRQATGQSFQNVVQSAGVSKYAMDNTMLQAMALLAQEQGSRIGTGINTAIKNLTGVVLTKEKIKNLSAMGLIDKKTPGAVGPGGVLDVFKPGGGAEDEEGLRNNIINWVFKDIFPKMEEQGLSPYKAEDASKFASQITSGKGTDALTGLIVQMAVLHRDLDQMKNVPGTAEAVDKISSESSRVAFESAGEQFTSVLGELADKTKVLTIPALHALTTDLSLAADQVKAGKIDPVTAVKGLFGAGGAAALLGVSANLEALTSKDPGIAALGSASIALDESSVLLDGSAAALTAAAVALGGAATAQGSAGLLGKVGVGAGVLGATETAAGATISAFALPVASAAVAIAMAHDYSQPGKAKEIMAQPDPGEAERRRIFKVLNPTEPIVIPKPPWVSEFTNPPHPISVTPASPYQDNLPRSINKLSDDVTNLPQKTLKVTLTDLPPKPIAQPARPYTPTPLLETSLTTTPTPVQMLKADVVKLATPTVEMPPVVRQAPLPTTTEPVKAEIQIDPTLLKQIQAPPVTPTPVTMAEPKSTMITLPEIPDVRIDPNGLSQLSSTSDSFASTFSAGASTMSGASDSFSAAFSSGAASISSAGTSIAASMTGAAAGAGAIFGNTAAGIISSSVSSLSISVNAKVNSVSTGADTGSQKAAE